MAFIVALLCIVLTVFGISSWRKDQIKKAWNEAYNESYKITYNNTEQEYLPKLEKQKVLYTNRQKTQQNEYEKKIHNLRKEYEIKITSANIDGLTNGKKDRLAEANQEIENKAKENKEKGNWNAVLFKVKKGKKK